MKNAREKKVLSAKEEYRKKAKRKAIQTLIKKKLAVDNALLKNTSAQGTINDDDVNIEFKITVPDENNGDDNITYVKYIPPPPENPPPLIHLCERHK